MGIFAKTYSENRDEMKGYYYMLCLLGNVGSNTYEKMQLYFDSPKALFLSTEERRERAGIFNKAQLKRIREVSKEYDPLFLLEKAERAGINFVCKEDVSFPTKLNYIKDYPLGLFYYGSLPPDDVPSVAVIGARECSVYGEEIAHLLGSALGKRNIPVISGMARGVDSLSQISAVSSGGSSYAILGGGPDICYPKESKNIYERLKSAGGVISEYPPGTPPVRLNFTRRNRLISGLCDILCVVEAREKSGTLITVEYALEQGKDIRAVPGRITDRPSMGCNLLIKDGAGIISDVGEFADEVCEMYGYSPLLSAKEGKLQNKEIFSKEELAFLNIGKQDYITVSDIMNQPSITKMGIEKVYGILNSLEAKGALINLGGGRYVKKIG